jgi:hypothetical protein
VNKKGPVITRMNILQWFVRWVNAWRLILLNTQTIGLIVHQIYKAIRIHVCPHFIHVMTNHSNAMLGLRSEAFMVAKVDKIFSGYQLWQLVKNYWYFRDHLCPWWFDLGWSDKLLYSAANQSSINGITVLVCILFIRIHINIWASECEV